ncbi:enolase C-terminal domain-like protein [Bacillus xiamenensis]|uniref:enolase C-terminal domain-like protein n=1 Tax=Bacillus xiamenensis TaxID=1178537 RepID=UPI00028D88CF|nr:enolase C-terminal domain-like protein [Bacillus xiamenensis]EKF34063.1 mandelate racemase/muconate lactonizing protein [Bacillus xiamenensis]MCW1837219.1 starvation-sensing protein RspA [Bacillus xiamenensis]
MRDLTIRDVKVILTAPGNIDLVVVKIETNEPGLYGLGCATFTQRIFAVKSAIEDYLKPFLIGKDPKRIEDIWQSANVSGYWRNGPIMNNALSGIDMALWDIKGKLAHLPVYELLGGKCREGIPLYRHADGPDEKAVEENVLALMEEGYQYARCQMGMYGGSGTTDTRLIATIYEKSNQIVPKRSPKNALPGCYFDPEAYARSVDKLFDYLRSKIGFNMELIHDVHERIPPIEAVRLAKNLEPYQLFFLEDPVAPENIDWLQTIRQQSTTPIGIGELFTNINEWKNLIINQQIDFIRCHVSTIGGITPAKKLAVFSELFGVRTAWHGPGDISPVGVAANLHLDLSSPNFGIQEWTVFNEALQEVFPGCPTVDQGFAYVNDLPGLGVDIDEEKAKLYPPVGGIPSWTLARTPDGTAVRP